MTSWRTVRVFISSTFRDMHAERDHLVRFVFPRLREELLKRRIHLVDVDLRWGVTADQDAFDLCMDEIQRCHPRFICILGGRYGWVPPPKTVAADFMERVLAGGTAAGPITSDERAAITALYELDPSTASYRLREKPRTTAEVKRYYAQGELAVAVFQRAGLGGVDRSITASEIHFGALDRLQEPAFRYFYFRDPTVTESIPQPHAEDYREPTGSFAEWQLDAIKSRIKDPETRGRTLAAPGDVVEAPLPSYEYPCRWDGDSKRVTDLKAFGDRVYEDLLKSVEAEYGTAPPEKLDEFAEENAAMEAFVEERTERYVVGTRRPIFDLLRQHVEGTGGNGYLCLVGEPGSGKSALLAQFYRGLTASPPSPSFDIPRSALRTPHLVISHFVGASAGSTDVRRTLRRFCHELKTGTSLGDDIPEDFDKLRQAFPEFLASASQTHHVVIFLDAINQFDPSYQSSAIHWLPHDLPPNVRIILSSLLCEALEALRKRRQPPEQVPLPALAESDAKAIMDGFLARYRKTLDFDQRTALLAKTDAGMPLYLLPALEELRTLGAYNEISCRIVELPPTTHELFTWILKRLENDDGFRDASGRRVGHELVSRFAALLGASRYGLSQRELADLLNAGDPQGNVAALLHLLRPYLMRRGELLNFYHTQLKEAVGKRYLSDEAERSKAHKIIADYFETRWREPYTRALSELPYHLTEGELWKELHRILTDFEFIEAKCRSRETGVYELLEDYRRGLNAPLSTFTLVQRQDLASLHRLMLREHRTWKDDPRCLFPQLYPYLVNSSQAAHLVVLAHQRAAYVNSRNQFWLRRADIPKPRTNVFSQYRIERSHPNVCFSVLATDLLAFSSDIISLWNLETGEVRELYRAEHSLEAMVSKDDKWLLFGGRGLRPHALDISTGAVRRSSLDEWIYAMAILTDGRIALSAGRGKVLVWQPESDQIHQLFSSKEYVNVCAPYLRGQVVWGTSNGKVYIGCPSRQRVEMLYQHQHPIVALKTALGRRIVSADDQGTIVSYDPATCRKTTIEFAGRAIVDVGILPDGKVVAGVDDVLDERTFKSTGGTVEIWDTESSFSNTVAIHKGSVTALDVSQNGTVVSGGWDGTVFVWKSEWAEARNIGQHESHVIAVIAHREDCVVSADSQGHLVAWDFRRREPQSKSDEGAITTICSARDGGVITGSTTGYVKIWNREQGTVRIIARHRGAVTAIALLPGGAVASGGRDGFVRVWDPTHNLNVVMHEHQGWVTALGSSHPYEVVSASEDGRVFRWNYRTGLTNQLSEHAHRVLSLSVLLSGNILSTSRDVMLWQATSDASRLIARDIMGYADAVTILGVEHDKRGLLDPPQSAFLNWMKSSRIIVFAPDGWIYVALDSGEIVQINPDENLSGRKLGYHGGLCALLFIAEDTLLSGGRDGRVVLWRRSERVTHFEFPSPVRCLTLAGDQPWIVVGLENGELGWLALEPVAERESTMHTPALLKEWTLCNEGGRDRHIY